MHSVTAEPAIPLNWVTGLPSKPKLPLHAGSVRHGLLYPPQVGEQKRNPNTATLHVTRVGGQRLGGHDGTRTRDLHRVKVAL